MCVGDEFCAAAADCRQKFARCLRALRWIDSQHRLQQRDHTRRHVRILQLLERKFLGLFCRNFSERAPNKWHTTGKQIPKRYAERIDVRSRIDFHLFGRSELLWAREGWGSDE